MGHDDIRILANKFKKLHFPYRLIVQSNSMNPCLRKDQSVWIKPIAIVDALNIGDIIVYIKFDTHLTVHRIIRKLAENTYKTKGDNNSDEDDYCVDMSEIVGVVMKGVLL